MMDIEQFKRYVARMNPKLDDLNRYIQTHATLSKEDLEELVACIDKQAVQIGELQQEIATRNDTMNATVVELVSAKDEIRRLKELVLQGEDFIEEEWETVRSFGVLRAKRWYGSMMDEIAKIKAAQPQKGQDNDADSTQTG